MTRLLRQTRTRGPRRDGRRPLAVVLSGLAVVALLVVLVGIAFRAPDRIPLRDYTTLYASVPDAGNLQPHSEVRIHGVRVGQVIKVLPRRGEARLELQLESHAPALPVDTAFSVRGKGLLGARFVELRPGRSERTLADGATIHGDEDALTYGVPEALETFDRETRGAFGAMLDGFGEGLLGRGRGLNEGLRATPPAMRDSRAMFEAILARDGAAARLLPSLRHGAAALDAARNDIAGSFSPGADAFAAFADRADSLEGTLIEAPSSLAATRSGLKEGRRLLASTRALSLATSDALPAAPPAFRAATALLRESRVPFRRTATLLRAARPTVPSVLRVTDRLDPVLDPLKRALNDLRPLVGTLGAYGCDLDNLGENWRSALQFAVPTPDGGARLASGRLGPVGTFPNFGILGPESVQSANTPDALLDADPYPAPCKYSPGPTYRAAPEGGSR